MSETERLTEIRQNLIATFDEGDLRTLCFDLSMAFSPDGRLIRGDGSYKLHVDTPINGYIQNHHRHQSLLGQMWRPAR